MAFNGSGTFLRLYSWAQDKLNDIDVSASRMDNEMDGFADGLSNCMTLDGQSLPAADIPMNGKKFTNLGDATVATDALNRQSGDARFASLTAGKAFDLGGVANIYTLTTGFSYTSLTDGQLFAFVPNATSTTSTPTLAVDSVTAKPIKLPDGGAPPAGALVAGQPAYAMWDETNAYFRLVTVLPATIPGPLTISGNMTVNGALDVGADGASWLTAWAIASDNWVMAKNGIFYCSADFTKYVGWNGSAYVLGGRTGQIVTNGENPVFSAGMSLTGAMSHTGSLNGALYNMTNTSANGYGFLSLNTATDANNNFLGRIYRAQNTVDNFLELWSDYNGTPDREFRVRHDGAAFADGAYTGTGADYAEYFEWHDGNPTGEDRRGRTVFLLEGKIACADDPAYAYFKPMRLLGVVSARPVVVGDAHEDKWSGKYLTDDFGEYLREPVERAYWDEYEETATFDPAGRPVIGPDGKPVTEKTYVRSHVERVDAPRVPIPKGAKVVTEMLRIVNPAYDPTKPYVPRSQRPEWAAVGLVGKLRLLKGQPVDPRWDKLRDISAAVEEWLVR